MKHDFPLRKSMLTIPGNLLFFHVLGGDLQNDLTRDEGGADWPVVSWALLLALSGD